MSFTPSKANSQRTAWWTYKIKPLLIELFISLKGQYDACKHGNVKDLMPLADKIETTSSAPFLRVFPYIAENTDRVAINGILEAS